MRQRFYTVIRVNKRTRINSVIIFFFYSSFSPVPVLYSTAVSVSRPLSPSPSTPQPGQHAAEYFYNRNVRHAPCFHISNRNVHHAESGRQLNPHPPPPHPLTPPPHSPASFKPWGGGGGGRERKDVSLWSPSGMCDFVWCWSLISVKVNHSDGGGGAERGKGGGL